MTEMVATVCVRGSVVIAGCALVVSALLGGCTRSIMGIAHPLTPGEGRPAIPVAGLLIDPERFPDRYPAAVLDEPAVDRVLQDIDGVSAASTVTPPECAPPPVDPRQTAAARGIDSDTAGSLIVAVTRGSPPLAERAQQLTACPSFTAVRGADSSAVTVTVLPAPPVNADDTYAVDQTVIESGLTRRTLTLAAQVGDVRVSATWLHQGAPDSTPDVAPDTQPLDTVFSDAVLKVRRVGGP